MTKRLLFASLVLIGACEVEVYQADGTKSNASPADSTLLGSCCSRDERTLMAQQRLYEATPPAERPPELAILPYRNNSALSGSERSLVTDSVEWAQMWSMIVGSNTPKPPLPRVDFSREWILIAVGGQRPTGGYSIEYEDVKLEGNTLTGRIVTRTPGKTCGTTAALTTPVALARVKKAPNLSPFRDTVVVVECG